MNIDLAGANWRKSSRSSAQGQCVEIAYLSWRKSSHSSANGACVEIAYDGELAAARDSKNPNGHVLVFPADALRALTRLS